MFQFQVFIKPRMTRTNIITVRDKLTMRNKLKQNTRNAKISSHDNHKELKDIYYKTRHHQSLGIFIDFFFKSRTQLAD